MMKTAEHRQSHALTVDTVLIVEEGRMVCKFCFMKIETSIFGRIYFSIFSPIIMLDDRDRRNNRDRDNNRSSFNRDKRDYNRDNRDNRDYHQRFVNAFSCIACWTWMRLHTYTCK